MTNPISSYYSNPPAITGLAGNSSSNSGGFSSLLDSFSPLSDIGSFFGMGGPGLYPDSLNDKATVESAIGSSGPLPTFLHMVSEAEHFTTAQTQSLYDIAAENMNIQDTPDAVHDLSVKLQQAGLPA